MVKFRYTNEGQRELAEQNRKRMEEFLRDAYINGFQEVEFGRGMTYSYSDKKPAPINHGIHEIWACTHTSGKVKTFQIPIETYAFLCLEPDDGFEREFETVQAYQKYKDEYEIRVEPKQSLDTYLYRNKIGMEVLDFSI